jgi:flagellar biosynthesis protein FlhF
LTTRLDMARRLGSMLTAAHEAGLALCDASTSPRAAEGLTPLSPTSLARLMMPGSETSERRAKQTGTHA